MLKNSLLKQPSEEDPDEGIKDLVEITLKKMVSNIISRQIFQRIFFVSNLKLEDLCIVMQCADFFLYIGRSRSVTPKNN